jgi:hypothetical protein
VTLMLFTEILAASAAVLGVTFRSRLHVVLYSLVEIGGFKCDSVRSVALISLENIALYCEYKSAVDMVRRNSDYFVNTFSQRMRYIRSYPQTPQVMRWRENRENRRRERGGEKFSMLIEFNLMIFYRSSLQSFDF